MFKKIVDKIKIGISKIAYLFFSIFLLTFLKNILTFEVVFCIAYMIAFNLGLRQSRKI